MPSSDTPGDPHVSLPLADAEAHIDAIREAEDAGDRALPDDSPFGPDPHDYAALLDLARTVRERTAEAALREAAAARLEGRLGEWGRSLTLALKAADVEPRRCSWRTARLWGCDDAGGPYAVGGPHVAAVHRERYEETKGSRAAVLRGYRRQLRVLGEIDTAAFPAAAPSLLADHVVEIESRHGEPIYLDLFYVRWSLASLGILPGERRTLLVRAGRDDQPVVLSLAERGSYAVIMPIYRGRGAAAGRASTRVEVRPVEVAS